MKISQLVEFNIDEARAGGEKSTRATSQATGQNIGRTMKYMSPDQAQRSIQAQKNSVAAQQPQATEQPTLAQRLAARKAEKLQQATQANQQTAPVPAGNDGGQVEPALTNAPLPGPSQADPALTNPNTALANPNTPQNIKATPQATPKDPKAKSKFDWGKAADTAGKFINAIPQNMGAFTDLVGNTAQNMAPGLRNTAHAIGDVGNAAARGIGGIGNALSATTDALGRTAGGLQGGYQKALGTHASQTGGGGGGNSIGNSLRQSAGVGGGAGGGGNSVASLSQRLARVEKELGLAESKRQGTYYPNARRKAS